MNGIYPYMIEYVTAKNLARLVGITKRAIIYHIERGNLSARMIGCQFLIPAQEALAFAEKHQAGAFKRWSDKRAA